MDAGAIALLGVASIVAGAINAMAGGGSLVTFPAGILVGLSPLVANTTNAVALTPGAIASAWAYRRELAQDTKILKLLALPALVGAIGGSALLLLTPQKVFDAIVPLLVLLATGLLLYQNLAPKKAPAAGTEADAWGPQKRVWVVLLIQGGVGVYGGYFGAGIGIMMLAMLGLLGGRDIHRMNGVKVVLGAVINAVASLLFLGANAVDLPAALVMSVGAIIGGLAGAGIARRTDPRKVRWLIVTIGVVLTLSLAWKRWAPA